MAKIEEFEQYKAHQRRLALLALLADQPKATTACLEDEQLASLVEGALPQEEVDQYMVHLAQCDRCSGLWVQLDQEWQRQEKIEQRNKRRKLQKKPRPFTVAGSLLAAAASVAVFVTITTRVDRKISLPLTTPPARQQELAIVPPAPSEEKGVAQESVPAAAPPQEQELAAATDSTAEPVAASQLMADRAVNEEQAEAKKKESVAPPAAPNQAPLLASGSANVAEKEGGPATLAAAPEPMARMAKPATVPPQPTVGGAAPLSVAAWQEQLRRDCTQPPSAEQLTALADQGRQMLASAALDAEGRQRVTTLLEVLERQEEVELRCTAILELLGPATQRNTP